MQRDRADILVLGANASLAAALPARLVPLGYSVEVRKDLWQGVELLLRGHVDLVLLGVDPEDPEAQALGLLRTLKKRAVTEHLPVVVLVPQDASRLELQAHRLGADDVFSFEIDDARFDARMQAILQRARRAAELREEGARARAALDLSASGVLVFDEEATVVHANRAAFRLLGLDPDVLRVRGAAQILQSLGLSRVVIERLLAAEGAVEEEVSAHIGDRELVLRVSASRIGDGLREKGTRGLVVEDVTEAREQERQQADFHSMIAHDLRNPLSVIQGYLSLLDGPEAQVAAPEIAPRIRAKVEEVSALLDDFLDLSRLDAGFLALDPHPIDVRDWVEDIVDEARLLTEGTGLEVEFDARAVPPRTLLDVDARRMRQVLQNLLTNAIKYGRDGGRVRVEAALQDGWIRLSVIDQGPGIPVEEQGRVFERYQRASRDEGDARGVGLGLLIVRRIVQAHGGQVGLESAVGEGATFWVRLPGAKAPVVSY